VRECRAVLAAESVTPTRAASFVDGGSEDAALAVLRHGGRQAKRMRELRHGSRRAMAGTGRHQRVCHVVRHMRKVVEGAVAACAGVCEKASPSSALPQCCARLPHRPERRAE